MTKELSEAEAAKVAAFGLDKKPDLAELMAVAAVKMLDGAAQVNAAMKKFVARS